MDLPLAIGLGCFLILVLIVLYLEATDDDRPGEPDHNALRYQPDESEAGDGRVRFP